MMTVSEAKLAANRANSQLSTGPTSEAGKAKVRLNAVKTGLTGRTVLLPTDDVAAYESTIASFTEQWQPETDQERDLVQALADNHWRTQRIPSLEYGIFAIGQNEFAGAHADEPDPDVRRTLIQTQVFLKYHKQLLNLQSQEARLRRHRLADESELQKLQGDRRYKAAKQRQAEEQAAKVAAAKGGFEFQNSSEAPRKTYFTGIAEMKAEIAKVRAEDAAEAARKSGKAA